MMFPRFKFRRKLPEVKELDVVFTIKIPNGTEVSFTELDGITPIDVETFRNGEDLYIKLPISGGYMYYGGQPTPQKEMSNG